MCTSNTADIGTKALLLLNNLSFTLLTALCPEAVVGEGMKITSAIFMISQTYQLGSLKTLHVYIGNSQRRKKHNQKVYFALIYLTSFDLEPPTRIIHIFT